MPELAAMPDPMAKWTPTADWSHAELIREHWRARPVLGLTQTLIGGRLDLALAALAPGARFVGLWQFADVAPYALRIGRDKAQLVGGIAAVERSGWRDDGWTASAASDAQAVFEIEGAATRDIVAEAVAADLDAESPSAAVVFAGVPALLHRAASGAARLHVEASLAAYVWRWLETRPD